MIGRSSLWLHYVMMSFSPVLQKYHALFHGRADRSPGSNVSGVVGFPHCCQSWPNLSWEWHQRTCREAKVQWGLPGPWRHSQHFGRFYNQNPVTTRALRDVSQDTAKATKYKPTLAPLWGAMCGTCTMDLAGHWKNQPNAANRISMENPKQGNSMRGGGIYVYMYICIYVYMLHIYFCFLSSARQ